MLRIRRWVVGVVLGVLIGQPPLWADGSVVERVEVLVTLAEKDNAAAYKALKAMGESVPKEGDYPGRKTYLNALIGIQVDGGLVDEARASIAELQELATRHSDEPGIALAVVHTASLDVQSGNASSALAQLKRWEPRALATGDAQTLWHLYGAMAAAQLTLGQFEACLDSTFKFMEYVKKQPHQVEVLSVRGLNTLANVYMGMTNWDKALQVIQEALPQAQAAGSIRTLGSLYVNEGAVLTSLGKVKEAIASYEKALALARESGQLGLEATALNNIGDSYLIAKNYAKAESFARQAMVKSKAAGEVPGFCIARSNLGFALMGQGHINEGATEVRAGVACMRKSGAKSDEEGVLAELSQMYEQAGWYREALAAIREQQVLSAELFRRDREKAVAAMQEQFDSVQRQKQIELLARENSLKDSEIANRRLQQIITFLGAVLTVVASGFVYLLYLRVNRANEQLREVNQKLEFHAVRDPLTGLYNRRSFFDLMQKRTGQAGRERHDDAQPDGLMILDIDHFKHINDTLGHGGGDAVLIEIANRLRHTVRETDLVMRWGGEEFLIYSPKATVEHLQVLAQRVLKAIGETPIEVSGAPLTVTATGGFLTLPFSGLPEEDCNWEKAVLIADMALYLGKVNGRNRAYGLARLLGPFDQVMPVLERDISAALKANMVELLEVHGPISRSTETA